MNIHAIRVFLKESVLDSSFYLVRGGGCKEYKSEDGGFIVHTTRNYILISVIKDHITYVSCGYWKDEELMNKFKNK